ncbi:MAG: Asp23/Gls24 family envelope stress response protein [Anaerolineae bacterium]|nr:Asp23/Gls24 family envelope stress response protein [Anaerolineae bacterium]
MPTQTDRIVVHPRVVATIAALTALSVPGVARMDESGLERVLRCVRGRRAPGVELHLDGNSVAIDLRLVVSAGFSLLEVSRRVQAAVSRAITEMTDMQVRQVNVQIEGVRGATYA